MNEVRCSKCGCLMVLRSRKSDGARFFGCSNYPRCTNVLPFEQASKIVVEKKEEQKKEFKPSAYQQRIFDWVQGDGKSLVVEALAGSGKTTTGVQMLKYLPKTWDVVYVAFNKHIADELKTRVPDNVRVMTYHSLGYSAVRNAYGNVKLDENKSDSILQGILDKYNYKHIYPTIKHLASLVKANLTGTTQEELDYLSDRYGIELNGDKELIFLATAELISKAASMTQVIDFDDMCWLPVFHNLATKKYDFIFIDEAQDTNKNQVALALMSVKEEGRIVAVGDRYQSIYGFRGADVDAIPSLIENLDADTLPLSITYRCPKSHVELVNKMFPEIPLECAETSKDGAVRNIGRETFSKEVSQGDMVLCRCNAPLVAPAFDLIRRGIKAVIRGRDIGTNLTTIIRKLQAKDIEDLNTKLHAYVTKEVAKLVAREKNNQAQSLQDKVDTIQALMDGVESITALEDKIEMIFSDNVAGVVFSSVHKAKGLEAEKVYILEPSLMPHKMAKKDWELQQERNIQYVAYTRSLSELILVG